MIFVPVWDMNHLKSIRFQYVTIALILLNTILFVIFGTSLFFDDPWLVAQKFALIPQHFLPIAQVLNVRLEELTFISYMFFHDGFFHLLANMIFLFVFGDNVEDAMGHVRFIVFFVACGVVAGLVHTVLTVKPASLLIGASGAVSGVIGAYLVLHPNIRVWVLLPLANLPFIPLRFSAGFVIGVWAIYQVISEVIYPDASTAWWTHLGGFATGILLILVMRRPGVRLFDHSTGV